MSFEAEFDSLSTGFRASGFVDGWNRTGWLRLARVRGKCEDFSHHPWGVHRSCPFRCVRSLGDSPGGTHARYGISPFSESQPPHFRHHWNRLNRVGGRMALLGLVSACKRRPWIHDRAFPHGNFARNGPSGHQRTIFRPQTSGLRGLPFDPRGNRHGDRFTRS